MPAHLALRASIIALGMGASAAVWAQTAPPAPGGPLVRDETRFDRNTQRVDHIQIEDAGSRVDEIRAGGETRSITVQPKANVPSYDVQPADVTRPVQPEGGPGSAGQRTWKILNF